MTYLFNNKIAVVNGSQLVSLTNPFPVTLGSQNITITGSVNVGTTVTVDSTPQNPVHVHLTESVPLDLSSTTLAALETITANQGAAGSSAWKVDIGTNGVVGLSSGTTIGVTGTFWPDTQPISGSVSISSLPEVEIKNNAGNPIPISATTAVNSNINPIYVKGTSDTSFFAATQSDAFGRLRVSNPFTLGDFFNRYQDNGSSFNYTAGGGSAGYDANNAAVTMNVGTANGDTVYRETSKVFAYQPGKSLLVLQTFTFAAPKANLTQRAGYFDTANGFYLEQVGTTINFVKRTSVSGSIIETRVPQTGVGGWNVNQLPSLDLTQSQIFWMDIEWLGVGSVRMGFVIDGQFVHCHTWNHANQITGVYITTSCLPVRKEIFNTGATAGSSTMFSICTSVVSEGGYTFTGREFCIGHVLGTPVSLPNDRSFKPILSIRLKSSRLGAIVVPTTYNVTPVESGIFKYQIYQRAITTGGTWVSAGSNSSVEYNLNPSIISSGDIVLTAFINSSNQSSGTTAIMDTSFETQLERNTFTSTCYEYVIGVAAGTNSTSCYGTLNWKEIT